MWTHWLLQKRCVCCYFVLWFLVVWGEAVMNPIAMNYINEWSFSCEKTALQGCFGCLASAINLSHFEGKVYMLPLPLNRMMTEVVIRKLLYFWHVGHSEEIAPFPVQGRWNTVWICKLLLAEKSILDKLYKIAFKSSSPSWMLSGTLMMSASVYYIFCCFLTVFITLAANKRTYTFLELKT